MELKEEEGPKFLKFALADLPETEWKKRKMMKQIHPVLFSSKSSE